VSVDRITTLFTQMKHSKTTWDDAVRDSEARCEELRREHNVLQEALKSVYERESAPVGDVQRRLHEVGGELELKSDKVTESQRRVNHLYQLMAVIRSGLGSAMHKTSAVAPEVSSSSLPSLEEGAAAGEGGEGEDSSLDVTGEEDERKLENELPGMLKQFHKQLERIMLEIKELYEAAGGDNADLLPGFKGFAPLSLVSTSSTSKRPVTITIDGGSPAEVLGIKVKIKGRSPGKSSPQQAAAREASADSLGHGGLDALPELPGSDEGGAGGGGDDGAGEAGAAGSEEEPGQTGAQADKAEEEQEVEEAVDDSGYENDGFENEGAEAEEQEAAAAAADGTSPLTSPKRDYLRPQPRAPPIAGMDDLGLFPGAAITEAVASITFPQLQVQRRVRFPKAMRRKDKRKGLHYCSDSDTQVRGGGGWEEESTSGGGVG
jgi:hypothetical protein